MPNYGIYSNEDRKGGGVKSGSTQVITIPVSAFFRPCGRSVVVKSNYLKTRGLHRGKLLESRRQFGKIKAHISYVGRRAVDKTFYNEEGQEISKDKVWEEIKKENPYIVHRMVLSPGKVHMKLLTAGKDLEDGQFHAYVKHEMKALKETLQEGKNFDYVYAKHGGEHPHAHAIIYSNNWLAIKKDNLEHMREAGNEFIQALEKGKVLEPVKEMKVGAEKEADWSQSL